MSPTAPRKNEAVTAKLSLLDHLEALRRTLLAMGAVLLLCTLLCFHFAPQVMELLRRPADEVLRRNEQAHLPSAVTPEDWQQARRLATLRGALGEREYAALQTRVTPRVQQLGCAVLHLRAAEALPADTRLDFLRACAANEEEAELTTALAQAGAELADPHPRAEMMGAFRPGEALMISLGLSFCCGLAVAMPLLLWLGMRYAAPALRRCEQRLLLQAFAGGMALFAAGVAAAYYLILPRVLYFFYDYSQTLGIANEWRIGYYLGFSAKLLVVFGLVCELPAVLLPLIHLRLLSYGMLRRARAAALVGSCVSALLLAPAPDPATMLLLALPLYVLFELCLLYARCQEPEAPR